MNRPVRRSEADVWKQPSNQRFMKGCCHGFGENGRRLSDGATPPGGLRAGDSVPPLSVAIQNAPLGVAFSPPDKYLRCPRGSELPVLSAPKVKCTLEVQVQVILTRSYPENFDFMTTISMKKKCYLVQDCCRNKKHV